MKRINILVILVLCIAISVLALSACTSVFKQKSVPSDLDDLTISSNGGLAVSVGKYLYFINGSAGEEGYNQWNKTVKGAIMRVELSEDKTPKRETLTTIIPKNVHGSKEMGLVIMGDKMFFTSPSTKVDGQGNPITSKMVLLMANLDGSGVKVIKEFDSYGLDYRITNNGYVLYIISGDLYSINLSDKKMKPKKVEEKITGYKFMKYYDSLSDFSNSIYYTKSSENKTAKFNEVWSYTAGGEKKKVMDGDPEGSYKGKVDLEDKAGYSISLVSMMPIGRDVLRLVYNKSDNGINNRSQGTYSFDFDLVNSFKWEKEVRYSTESVKELHFIGSSDDKKAGKYVIATSDKGIYFSEKLAAPGNVGLMYDLESFNSQIVSQASTTIVEVLEKQGSVVLNYLDSSHIKSREVLSYDKESYEIVKNTIDTIFKASAKTEWLPIDVVFGNYYFFNSDVSDNIYWYETGKVDTEDKRSMKPKLLGKISPADELSMVSLPDY